MLCTRRDNRKQVCVSHYESDVIDQNRFPPLFLVSKIITRPEAAYETQTLTVFTVYVSMEHHCITPENTSKFKRDRSARVVIVQTAGDIRCFAC